MKFEKLYITGFGALRELEFPDISPGLNIIEGANEAGKTTMLEFVRALFFGFAQRDKSNGDARRYLPKDGGAHGGSAIVQNSRGEQLRIERMGDKSSSGLCNVQLLNANREINWEALLSGADRLLYEQIFAFSLDELNGLSASVEQMEKRVYAASSGSLGALLLNALDKTETAAEEIYRKRGSNPALNKAIAEFKKIQNEVKQLSGQIENYNNDRARFLEYAEYAESLSGQYKNKETALTFAKLHHDVWPTWVRLTRLRDELKALPERPELTVELFQAMEKWRAERRRCQEKLEEIKPRLERVAENIKKCIVEEVILQNAPGINYLKEQLAVYEASVREAPGLQHKWMNAGQRIIVQLQQLGPEWDEAKLEKIDISREPRLRIQQFETALEQARQEQETAAQTEAATARQIAEQQKSLQRLHAEIQREFPQEPPTVDVITQRLNAWRDAEELLRKEEDAISRGDQARENLQARQKYFSANQKKVYTPKVLFPIWTAALPLIAGFLALLFAGIQVLSVVLCVIFLAMAAGIIALHVQRKAEVQRWETAEKQQRAEEEKIVLEAQEEIQSWQQKAATARAEMREIAARFEWVIENRHDAANVEELLRAQREARSRYENLGENVRQREMDIVQITESQQEQQEKIAAAKSTFEARQKEWNQWLQARELPVLNTPQDALQLFDLIQKLRDELRSRDEYQQQLEAIQEQRQQFVNQVNNVWRILQRPAPSVTDIPAAVRALCDELDIQKKAAIRREALMKEQQDWQDNQAVQKARLADIEHQIANILNTANAADEAEFDASLQIAEQRKKREEECRKQEEILDTHSAPGPARLALETALGKLDAAQVQENLQTAKEAFEQCRTAMLEAERQRGEWKNKVQQLEENEGQLTSLLRQMEEQKTHIADLSAQWAVARAAHVLLEQTRARFEKERQPAVIKRAGALMRDVTAGRYQAVLASGKLNSVELDEGERGRKPLSHWSHGTKEQFYLALRLAFIEDYCSQGNLEPLPVVMDDVLVHADGYHRLAAASSMIAKFAEKYQVLYFTCRPGDADVLSKAAPAARRFRLAPDASLKVLL